MKRLSSVFIFCILIATSLPGQSPSSYPVPSRFEEPENHAIVVDRLVRYHDSGEYDRQIHDIANSAREYLETRIISVHQGDKVAAIFDIDETALSNWTTMNGCGFCSYNSQLTLYPNAQGSVIAPVLELYNFAKSKGITVFFITGRQEAQRDLTVSNLKAVGYSGWADLIMQPNGNKLPARQFKSEDRQAIVDKGYHIIFNIGDQASDLAGCCSDRNFKLPNPFYLVN
jgi:predicted secreted acid phosphatase